MSRIDVPITQITTAGVTPPAQVTGDPVNGHELALNDGHVFIEVVNADAAATHNVTVETPRQIEGLDVAEVIVTVGKSATSLIGPLPSAVFNQSTGKVNIDVADANLKLRAYRV